MKSITTYITEKLKITKDNILKDNDKHHLLDLDIKYLNDLNSENKEDDWKARTEIIKSIQEWMDRKDFVKFCFPKKKLRYEIVIDDKWSIWLTHDESYKGDDISLISVYMVLKTSDGKYLKYNYYGGCHVKTNDIEAYKSYFYNFIKYNNAWDAFRYKYDETDKNYKPAETVYKIETYSWKIETMI